MSAAADTRGRRLMVPGDAIDTTHPTVRPFETKVLIVDARRCSSRRLEHLAS
jgi:hypothetical protein